MSPEVPAQLVESVRISTTAHVDALTPALAALRKDAVILARWGHRLAVRLSEGHRLLAAGNGGSAAEAQHLTAELVGKFSDDRRPFSAIALHADTSSLTAIGNDYGYDEVFARQVTAHARPRDVVMLLSTSGRSRNLLLAAAAARKAGASCWALTGARPNPLATVADEVVCLPGSCTTVQEAQLVAVHALCLAFEYSLSTLTEAGACDAFSARSGRPGAGVPQDAEAGACDAFSACPGRPGAGVPQDAEAGACDAFPACSGRPGAGVPQDAEKPTRRRAS